MQIDSKTLNNLIGREVSYQGTRCRIIEILEEDPALVLQDYQPQKTVQPNQYGEANRRAPRVFTVALLNIRRDGLNPALVGLTELLG